MRLVLEPVEEWHLRYLKDLRNLPEVQDFCRQPNLFSMDSQAEWLKYCNRNKTFQPFIVSDNDLPADKKWVGYAALNNIELVSDKAECSCVIHPDFKGKGYGEEAMFKLLYHAFYDLGLQKVYTDTFDYNMPEVDMNKCCGFILEGHLQRHYFKRGRFIGSLPQAIFREGFDERYQDRLSKIKYADRKPL
jgi:diamine N-acetyltransferase